MKKVCLFLRIMVVVGEIYLPAARVGIGYNCYFVHMQEFDFSSLEKKAMECEECGWSGKGYETEKGYHSLPEAIEIYCPVCHYFFGEIKRNEDHPSQEHIT